MILCGCAWGKYVILIYGSLHGSLHCSLQCTVVSNEEIHNSLFTTVYYRAFNCMHPFTAAILVHILNRFSLCTKMAAVAVVKLLLCCDIICKRSISTCTL